MAYKNVLSEVEEQVFKELMYMEPEWEDDPINDIHDVININLFAEIMMAWRNAKVGEIDHCEYARCIHIDGYMKFFRIVSGPLSTQNFMVSYFPSGRLNTYTMCKHSMYIVESYTCGDDLELSSSSSKIKTGEYSFTYDHS